ncbi:MAG: DUF2085 domain-containing protein [Anaerolineaceae bacterium]
MIQAYLFTCPSLKEENDRIMAMLEGFQGIYPHQLTPVDVNQSVYLKKSFAPQVPCLEIGPYHLTGKITPDEIEAALEGTHAQIMQASQTNDSQTVSRYTQRPRFTSGDRFSLWFSRHYLALFNLLVFIYVALSFSAPVLMKLDLPKPANTLYKLYSPFCHQMAYRTFFLFGEQPYYPLAEAGMKDVLSYTQATGLAENDTLAAKQFIGNDRLGFKVALCQRDVAIYFSILLFGLLYALFKSRIKPIPWYIWVLFGLAPIGLDSISQLVSQLGVAVFFWFPMRESTPLLRILTGGMFGFFTAWFGYPTVEDSVSLGRKELEKKTLLTGLDKQKKGTV